MHTVSFFTPKNHLKTHYIVMIIIFILLIIIKFMNYNIVIVISYFLNKNLFYLIF